MKGYRHIIEKTNNAQVNAFNYALAKAIGTRRTSEEMLKNIEKSQKQIALDLQQLETDRADMTAFDEVFLIDGENPVSEVLDKKLESLEESANVMQERKADIERELFKLVGVAGSIEDKLYEVGAPVLDCVSTIDTYNGDHRRAFADADGNIDLKALEGKLNEIMAKHFSEGHYKVVPTHDFADTKPNVHRHNFTGLFSIAFNKLDIGKLQGFMEDFTDTLVQGRREALEQWVNSVDESEQSLFVHLNSDKGDEYQAMSDTEKKALLKDIAHKQTGDVGFSIGNGTCNVMNDFLETRSVNEILNNGWRMPYAEIPSAFHLNDVSEKLKSYHKSLTWFSDANKRYAEEQSLTAIAFVKENPDLALKGDLVYSSIISRDEAEPSKGLTSDNSPTL